MAKRKIPDIGDQYDHSGCFAGGGSYSDVACLCRYLDDSCDRNVKRLAESVTSRCFTVSVITRIDGARLAPDMNKFGR